MKITLPIAISILIVSSCASDTKKVAGHDTGDTTTAHGKVHRPDKTSVQLIWGTTTYDLNFISAYLWDDRLSIVFSDTGHRMNEIAIGLQRNTEKPVVTDVSSEGALLDCLYVARSFKIIQQVTQLNNDRYNRDDLIFGSIDLLLLGRKDTFREPLVPFADKRNWDTVRLKGSFTGRLN